MLSMKCMQRYPYLHIQLYIDTMPVCYQYDVCKDIHTYILKYTFCDVMNGVFVQKRRNVYKIKVLQVLNFLVKMSHWLTRKHTHSTKSLVALLY